MRIFGKEFIFNGYKVYHAGDKPTAADVGAYTKQAEKKPRTRKPSITPKM